MRKIPLLVLFCSGFISECYAIYSINPSTSYPAQASVSSEDAALSEKISYELSKGTRKRKYANVSFYVSYGNVTLQGTVNTLDDKNQAKRDILPIQGVKQIDNQIIVQPPESKY